MNLALWLVLLQAVAIVATIVADEAADRAYRRRWGADR